MMFMPRPRIGFIGGIDKHTFDPDLFLKVVAAMPDVQFVMVGGCSLPADWCVADNVTLLGRKPYDTIAGYMAAMDVLIMPWNNSDWIKACNPIKLKEYLAVGRPVVTTDFPALGPWRDLVSVAGDADTFALKIRHALMADYSADMVRARVAGESWDVKANLIFKRLVEVSSAKHRKTKTVADRKTPHQAFLEKRKIHAA
jgi:glycosyltransferase involved in cell wall biosynthesis